MPALDVTATKFTRGEMTPRAGGRLDLRARHEALTLCRNFVTRALGGFTRRMGSRYIAEVANSASLHRLVPFEFSDSDTVMLELGERTIRFYTQKAQILSPAPTPMELNFATAGVPWTSAQLADIKYAQAADILYLYHPDTQGRELQRLSALNYNLALFDSGDGPYLLQNIVTADTLTPSGTTGSITITASGTHAPFVASDVGRLVRILHGGPVWGYARITGFVSTGQVNADVVQAFASTAASSEWRLGAWSDTTGWPQAAEFFEERLFVGGTSHQPNTVHGSRTGQFNEFAPTSIADVTADTNGVTFSASSKRINTVRWMESGDRGMLMGTSAGLFLLSARRLADVVTPGKAEVDRHSSLSSHATAIPVRMDRFIIFTEKGGEQVNSVQFSFAEDGFVTDPVGILADHILHKKVKQIAETERPLRVIWFITDDGALYSMTFEPTEKVIAWHSHKLGGSFGSGDPVVESIATLHTGVDDEVWMIVKRTIDGATRRYVEVLDPYFRSNDVLEDAFYVDAGLTYSGAAIGVVTGLAHLEGESVDVLADGFSVGPLTVASGQITLPNSRTASKVHVGLPMPSRADTFPLEVPIEAGISTGKVKTPSRAHILFDRTGACEFGLVGSPIDNVEFRESDAIVGVPTPLFSGLKTVEIDGGPEREPVYSFQVNSPLPCEVLSVTIDGEIGNA